MGRSRLNVLLIGQSEHARWQLTRHFEQLRCHCWFASTTKEIAALLDNLPLRLVLSARPVTEGSALMELLSRPGRSVFYSYPVEGGCLWFEAAPDGHGRLKYSALRPNEFPSILNDLVLELQKSMNVAQGNDLVRPTALVRPATAPAHHDGVPYAGV